MSDPRSGRATRAGLPLCAAIVAAGLLAFLVSRSAKSPQPAPEEEPRAAATHVAHLVPQQEVLDGAGVDARELPSPPGSSPVVIPEDLTDPAPAPEADADLAGVTPAQRLEFLTNGHDFMRRVCADENKRAGMKRQAQEMFMLRCVATLLHAQGRAVYPGLVTEEEKKRFHVNAETLALYPGRHVFSTDGAYYEFFPGDFVAFDVAMQRLEGEDENAVCDGVRANLAAGSELEALY